MMPVFSYACVIPTNMSKREPAIYKVIFLNQGQVFEMYAKQIYQSDLWGFLDIGRFFFD